MQRLGYLAGDGALILDNQRYRASSNGCRAQVGYEYVGQRHDQGGQNALPLPCPDVQILGCIDPDGEEESSNAQHASLLTVAPCCA